jgi:hypothetical protein
VNTLTRRIRTNAGPVILASNNAARGGNGSGSRTTNVILDHARDCYSGSMSDWASELLWTTQVFRMAWDSPRIGGGIDPTVASNVPSLDASRVGGDPMVGYIVGSPDSPYDGETYEARRYGALNNLTNDEIQDMIVHAEAVALLALAVYGQDG